MPAPTAYRLMMAAGDAETAPIAGQLRVACSAGEPLNREVGCWSERVLRTPLADHYGQTEAWMVLNTHHGLHHTIKPGAAGLPMPGFSKAVLDDELRPTPPDTPGVLAIHRPTSPLFDFHGYWNAETPSFRGDWHLTGDTVQRDADGHYFFVGRDDDIIMSAGYRIGQFDVESSIIEHPSVAEVAVVGRPDPERTEIVKAFVVLRAGIDPSDALKTGLQQHVRTRLALHAYPREIEFIDELRRRQAARCSVTCSDGGSEQPRTFAYRLRTACREQFVQRPCGGSWTQMLDLVRAGLGLALLPDGLAPSAGRPGHWWSQSWSGQPC